MKRVLNLLIFLSLAVAAIAQPKQDYQNTRMPQVRADWSGRFNKSLSLPYGATPAFPAWVSDTSKRAGLYVKTGGTRDTLMLYDGVSHTWSSVGLNQNVLLNTGDQTLNGNLTMRTLNVTGTGGVSNGFFTGTTLSMTGGQFYIQLGNNGPTNVYSHDTVKIYNSGGPSGTAGLRFYGNKITRFSDNAEVLFQGDALLDSGNQALNGSLTLHGLYSIGGGAGNGYFTGGALSMTNGQFTLTRNNHSDVAFYIGDTDPGGSQIFSFSSSLGGIKIVGDSIKRISDNKPVLYQGDALPLSGGTLAGTATIASVSGGAGLGVNNTTTGNRTFASPDGYKAIGSGGDETSIARGAIDFFPDASVSWHQRILPFAHPTGQLQAHLPDYNGNATIALLERSNTWTLGQAFASATVTTAPAGSTDVANKSYVDNSITSQFGATLNDRLRAWAQSKAFALPTASRDDNSAIITASVVWPDLSTGTWTTDVYSTDFPGAVDVYHLTYVPASGPTKTITLTITSRDANGAALGLPVASITP